jgi:hypothetical protein
MRLATNPGFTLNNGELEKCFQTAFGVAEKFFPRWEVEKSRLTEALGQLPEALENVDEEPNGEPEHRQAINHWFAGRQQPTAEQILAVQEFLAKERRRAKKQP